MNQNIISNHDFVFLVFDDRRRWLVQVEHGGEFHSHRGIINYDDIIGKPYGVVVFSKPYETQGYKFYVFEPLASDYVLYMKRKTQIIYPEDAGLIIMYAGIKPGIKVIEAGCGSGALTCILGDIVRPDGHIFSYDIKEKNIKLARNNVKKANLSDFVSIESGDIISENLDHKNIDVIILDIPQPWEAVERVKNYLKLSGVFVSFSPTIEQVKKTHFALKSNEFVEIYTYELLKRTMQVKKNATRPQVRMIGHTGYITIARKIQDVENPYRERKPKKEEFVSLEGMPLKE
ncbi:MAG: tRNA (adenine-N1)-methyltransferase [Promethearchaeota archaeon]|nr:MAG: tRNA (adenine-N1)-methyltransferase [Candidatus Lokiarchaeota archaeon]